MGRDQIVYSFGAFGFNILHQSLTLWLVYFYAPPGDSGRPTLVPLALLGALLGAGRIVDAFDDAAIGYWSDVTRSRWGRRLPFIVGGAPFLFICFILLWTPPGGGGMITIFYAAVVIQLYFVVSSIVHQPYEAVLAEITSSGAVRVRVSSWKVFFGTVGAAVALVASGPVAGLLGFPSMAAIFGLIAVAAILLSSRGIRRFRPEPVFGKPASMVQAFRLTLMNGQFSVFVISEVMFYLGLNMLTQLIPYFVTVVLGLPESQVSWFTGAFVGTAILSLPGVIWLTSRVSKAFVYRCAMASLALLLPGFFVVGYLPYLDRLAQGLVYVAILGVPMAALFVLPNPFVADIIDDDELRTGQRRAGVYFGVEETLNKLGFALSAAIFGVVLETFGFSTTDPFGIRLIGPIAGVGVLFGLLIFTFGYRLPDQVGTIQSHGGKRERCDPRFR